MACRDCQVINAEIDYAEAEVLFWQAVEMDAYENIYAATMDVMALNIEWAECCSEET